MTARFEYPAPAWNLKWIDDRLIEAYEPPTPSIDFKEAKSLCFLRWANDEAWSGDKGSLRVDRAPVAGDLWQFRVEQALKPRTPSESQDTTAEFLCEGGDFPQLIHWSLASVVERKGEKIADTRYQEYGHVDGEWIVCNRGMLGVSEKRVGRPLTANWALFYSVPLWAADIADAPAFHTLEELQFHRPAQVVIAAGEADFHFGGGSAWRLRALKVMGQGLLPTLFWLDEAGRPLLVCNSVGFTYYLKDLA